jgi:hypothetical protein
MQHSVVFLPGIIAPAEVRYRVPIEHLPGIRALTHDLAVYDRDAPPAEHSSATELDAPDELADAAGLGRFHDAR